MDDCHGQLKSASLPGFNFDDLWFNNLLSAAIRVNFYEGTGGFACILNELWIAHAQRADEYLSWVFLGPQVNISTLNTPR